MMKILNIVIIGVVIALSIVSCNNSTEKESTTTTEVQETQKTSISTKYQVEIEKSVVNWKGSMVGVYAHEGNLKFNSGTFTITDNKVIGGTFAIDMNSIVTTDDDALYKMAPREKLIGHLKSDDFFSTDKFPTAKFTITGVNDSEITGDLSIKGMSNPVKFTNVTISELNNEVMVKGNLTFNRQNYGIAYKNSMNDMVLSDDIELTISVTGIK